MAIYERTSMLVSLTLVGLVILFLIHLPSRAFELAVLGSPLTIVVSQRWLMPVLLGGLAASGTSAIVHSHPYLKNESWSYCLQLWLLPGLLVALAAMVLPLLTAQLPMWIAGVVVTGILLWLSVLAQYHVIDPRDRWYEIAQLWLTLLAYALSFGFFVFIYRAHARSLVSAVELILVSSLLAAALLRAGPAQTKRSWLLAGTIALAMGQSLWALNYWQLPPLVAGFCMLLFFYVLTGLAQQHMLGRLSRRAMIEFAAVTLIGLFVIFRVAL